MGSKVSRQGLSCEPPRMHRQSETVQLCQGAHCELRPQICGNCSFKSALDARLSLCKKCYVTHRLRAEGEERMSLSDCAPQSQLRSVFKVRASSDLRLSGWDQVLAYLKVEDAQRLEANRRFSDALYVRDEIMREISKKNYKVLKTSADDTQFLLKHAQDEAKSIRVQAIKTVDSSQEVLWVGLPDALRPKMKEFSQIHQTKNAYMCLQVLIMTYGDKQIRLLKSEHDVRRMSTQIEEILKHDDPRDHYQVQQQLVGQQNNASFYLTKKNGTDELYMMKTLVRPIAEQNESLMREIALMRSIKCASVLQCTDAYYFEGRIWLFQDYMDGGNLQNLIEKAQVQGKRLSEQFCRYTLYQVSSALHAMHQQNILHRDFNSENIYIDSSGEIKLGDLAMSVYLTSERNCRQTRAATLPNWYSPEIIQGQPYSKEIDVWALGITAFQLGSGHLPYMDIGKEESMISISTEGLPSMPDHCSENFKDFVQKCTEMELEARWPMSSLIYHPFLMGADTLRSAWIAEYHRLQRS